MQRVMQDSSNAGDKVASGLCARSGNGSSVGAIGRYAMECRDEHGNLRWREEFDNVVTTVGKNMLLDYTFKTGSGGTPALYLGLITGPGGSNTYAAADTMSSHAGWAENTSYSQGTRVAWTTGTISGGSVDNTGSVATFSINGTATIGGAFLVTNSTKGGTTGTLYSAGNFANDRSVFSGDTLTVSYTATIT